MKGMAGVLVLALLLAVPAAAQWPPYPTRGVPRTPAGEPDLNGPPPRVADGKPDLSGIWENLGWDQLSSGVGGAGGAPGTNPAALTRPFGPALFFDIGSGVEGGLPLQPWAAELKKARMAAHSKDNPDAHCLPMGNMQFHTHPQPRKIIQTPDVIVILYEANGGLRQIFTDGRPLPDNDPQPWWYGYSVGRWEGDTLVVETRHFRDGGWLDVNGSPLTDAARMIERFRRPSYGTLELEITVDDPKAYTRPWTVRFTQRALVDTELIEFVCLENEKSTRYFDK
ncbi:MAG TPA: hypothetical protein VNI78_13095 [Vicinamibacterales bacterium]|nr:hypothetical protein [Vicinamibacterales bacterium]